MASFKVFLTVALTAIVLACFDVEASAAKDQAELGMMAFLGDPAVKRGKGQPAMKILDDLLCYGADQCYNVWCRQLGGECVGTGGADCDCIF